jgi:hypothetical protein
MCLSLSWSPCYLVWWLVVLRDGVVVNHVVLKEHVDLILNLLFKCFLVPVTLLVADRVFRKTMFP